MSSQQLLPWLRCRHLLTEFGDDMNAILAPFEQDILKLVGGIGGILKEFLKQKPQHISPELLTNLWNLLSSTKEQTQTSATDTDTASLLILSDDILSSVCTYLNLNDLNNLNQVCYITSIAIRLPSSHKLAVSQLNYIHHPSFKENAKQIIVSPFASQQYQAMQAFQSLLNENTDSSFDVCVIGAIQIGIASHLTQCLIRNYVYDAHFRFEAAQLLCDLLSRTTHVFTDEILQRIHQIITMKPVYDEDIVGIMMKQMDYLIAKDSLHFINKHSLRYLLPFVFEWIQCFVQIQYNKYEQYMMNIIQTLIISARQNVMQYILSDIESKRLSCNSLCKLLNVINCRTSTYLVKYDTVYYKKIRHHLLTFLLFLLKNAKDKIVCFVLNAHLVQYVLSVIHELNRTERDINDMHILGICIQIINVILMHSNSTTNNIITHEAQEEDINNDKWGTLISVRNEDQFELTQNEINIGSAENNDMKLYDLNDTHCKLIRNSDDNSIYLLDCSLDGIYVDDELLCSGNRIILHNGSKIVFIAGCPWTKTHEIAYILQLKETKEVTQELITWSYSKQIRQYMKRDSVGSYVLLSFALLLRNTAFISKILKNDSNDVKGLMDEIIDIIIEERNENNIKNGAECIFNVVECGTEQELKILNENHGVMAALFGLMDINLQRDQRLMVHSLKCIDILCEKQIMKHGSNYSQRIYKRKLHKLQYELIDDNQDNQFIAGEELTVCIQQMCQKYETDA